MNTASIRANSYRLRSLLPQGSEGSNPFFRTTLESVSYAVQPRATESPKACASESILLLKRAAGYALALILTFAAPAAAQGAAVDDYRIYGHLDVVQSLDGSTAFTTAMPIVAGLWTFECRSGLQPQTQRVGLFAAHYWRVFGRFGEVEDGSVTLVQVEERKDVAAAYQRTCPAVGPNVGLLLLVSPPPEPGVWMLQIDAFTTDGAGRLASWSVTQEILVQPGFRPLTR